MRHDTMQQARGCTGQDLHTGTACRARYTPPWSDFIPLHTGTTPILCLGIEFEDRSTAMASDVLLHSSHIPSPACAPDKPCAPHQPARICMMRLLKADVYSAQLYTSGHILHACTATVTATLARSLLSNYTRGASAGIPRRQCTCTRWCMQHIIKHALRSRLKCMHAT
jgi:hypothetical protein